MLSNSSVSRPTVAIVVLNWKGAQDTNACLDSIMNLDSSFYEFKIVVIDNCSPDDSYHTIFRHVSQNYECSFYADSEHLEPSRVSLKKISLLKTRSNLGFAGGNNVGIRFALNDSSINYVWVLNNDTIVERSSLGFLIEKSHLDESYGVIGSKLIYEHDRSKIQALGGRYNKYLGLSKHLYAHADADLSLNESEVEAELDYVVGASLFFKREVLEDIGLLSEEYFLFYEELDYMLLLKGKYKVGLALDSIVYHKEGAARKKEISDISDYYSVINRLVLTKKFYPYLTPIIWLSLLLVIVNRVRRRQFSKAKNIFMYQFFGRKAFS